MNPAEARSGPSHAVRRKRAERERGLFILARSLFFFIAAVDFMDGSFDNSRVPSHDDSIG
jgi:hypothetical protein